ncbi:MAG: hypothetical protein ACOYNZ_09690 [Rhodoferax sp.]
MSWKISKITSSLMALLGDSTPDLTTRARVEALRQGMLDHLADLDAKQRVDRVRTRIQYAPDIQALWYLRGDMMILLAEVLGESAATDRLADISDRFRGLLPAAQKSRPNRLRQ